jgi:hypothetical protein
VVKFLVEQWPQGLRTRNSWDGFHGLLPLHTAAVFSFLLRDDPVKGIRSMVEAWARVRSRKDALWANAARAYAPLWLR